MITCRELYSFLDDFLDDGLDAGTRAAFEGHLSRCVSCQRYLKTYQATIKAARAAEKLGESFDFNPPEELVRAILASRANPGAP